MCIAVHLFIIFEVDQSTIGSNISIREIIAAMEYHTLSAVEEDCEYVSRGGTEGKTVFVCIYVGRMSGIRKS